MNKEERKEKCKKKKMMWRAGILQSVFNVLGKTARVPLIVATNSMPDSGDTGAFWFKIIANSAFALEAIVALYKDYNDDDDAMLKDDQDNFDPNGGLMPV